MCSGLDPAATQETYATVVESRIFDALYVWDYLPRPYKFVPSIATSMSRSLPGSGDPARSTTRRAILPRIRLAWIHVHATAAAIAHRATD